MEAIIYIRGMQEPIEISSLSKITVEALVHPVDGWHRVKSEAGHSIAIKADDVVAILISPDQEGA